MAGIVEDKYRPVYVPEVVNPATMIPAQKRRGGCGCGGGCGGGEMMLNQSVTIEVDRTTQLILLALVGVQLLNFLKRGR